MFTKVIRYCCKKTDRPKNQPSYQDIMDEEILDYLSIADTLISQAKAENNAYLVTTVVTLCLALELSWKKYFMNQWEVIYKQEKGLIYFSTYHKLIQMSLDNSQDNELSQVEKEIIHNLQSKDPSCLIRTKDYKETLKKICHKYRNNSMHLNKTFTENEAKECRKLILDQLLKGKQARNDGVLPRFFRVFNPAANPSSQQSTPMKNKDTD